MRVVRSGEATIVRASAAAAQLTAWPDLVRYTVRVLGKQETFLRTGYVTSEIEATCARLDEKLKRGPSLKSR